MSWVWIGVITFVVLGVVAFFTIAAFLACLEIEKEHRRNRGGEGGEIDVRKRKGRRTMKKLLLATAALLIVSGLAIKAMADNPHYLRADASLTGDACYQVSLKEAGLGNSGLTEVQYDLTCNASFTVACINKGGNQVQGVPKNGSSTATESTILKIRNGQTNGTVTLCPEAFDLPDPGCTGNQREVLLEAAYSQCNLDDNLGTASPGLPNLSTGNIAVPF